MESPTLIGFGDQLLQRCKLLRSILVHLGRFMRMYLISCFVCVLVVPLFFNLADILFGPLPNQDLLYVLCALLPAVSSAVYVYRQRQRINSDELSFYVRERLRKQPLFVAHYFALNGLMVREVCPLSLDLSALDQATDTELNTAMMVYKAHAPADLYAVGHNNQQVINDQVKRVLFFIDPMCKNLGLTGKSLALARRSYLQGVRGFAVGNHGVRTGLAGELPFLEKQAQLRGPYLCQYMLISLMRTLLRALPEEQLDCYQELLWHQPLIKQVASMLLEVPQNAITPQYQNRYSYILQHELFRLKKQARTQFHFSSDAHSFTFDGEKARASYGPYADASMGQNGYQGFSYDFGAGPSTAKEWSYAQEVKQARDGAYYSYRNFYRDAYTQAQQENASKGYDHAFKREQDTQQEQHQQRSSASSEAGQQTGSRPYLTRLQRAYRTLELGDDATLAQVKRQYRHLVFKYHPDHIHGFMALPDAEKAALTQRLQEIVQAYNYIMCICADKDSKVRRPTAAS